MNDIAWPLIGHNEAELEAASALASSRLHHAWLLKGPSGVGKARFARRLAARLLGAKPDGVRPLDSSASDPVVESMLAGSHPDLRWLSREPGEKGKLPLFISVDRIRQDVINFVSLKPALGGKRVCVIDSVDELNISGANALLKSLEEPPADCVLLLIHHGQSSLLPTIRSRCRLLKFSPLSFEMVSEVLSACSASPAPEALALAGGRPGRALALTEPDAVKAIAAANQLATQLDRSGRANLANVHKAASSSEVAFSAFAASVLDWAASRAPQSRAHADAWLWISRTLDTARRDAMDNGQTAAKLMTGLQHRLASA